MRIRLREPGPAVKSVPPRRPLVRAALLASTLAYLFAAHPGVLVGSLAASLDGGHRLSLEPDTGHLDVVLHHDRHDDHGGPGLEAHEGDHVVHLVASDPLREGARRLPAPPAWLAAGVALAPASIAELPWNGGLRAAGRSAALLRTVVLRV